MILRKNMKVWLVMVFVYLRIAERDVVSIRFEWL